MLTLIAQPQDEALASRLKQDLKQNGFELSDALPTGKTHILIAVVSQAVNAASPVMQSIVQAFDNSQHVVLVKTDANPLPKLVNHLKTFDFGSEYPLQALTDQLRFLSSPEAGSPLKVLTPKVRARNRGVGLWLTIIVLFWFVVGLILVGFFRVQAPVEEYNSIETEVAATVAVIIQQNLPRSTEEAANFPATVQAVPTAQRPLLIETATALVSTRPPRQ